MKIRLSIELFAGLRAAAQCDQVEVDLPAVACADDILTAVGAHLPQTLEFMKVSRVAVDDHFLTGSAQLTAHSRVCIIPPVSGG